MITVFFIHWHILKKKKSFREGSSCLTHLPDVQLEVNPSVFQEEAVQITGCSLPSIISTLPFPNLHYTCLLALWPQGWSHFPQLWTTLTHMHTYPRLSKSSPFLQFRARHFKKVFFLFHPHHSQSVTKSCQFYLPSISRIHLVLFIFHSNSTGIDPPCSTLPGLKVFAQVVHLD